MNFKQFFLEQLGDLSNAHHQRVTSITKPHDSGITKDGKLKPLKPRVAAYRTKKMLRNINDKVGFEKAKRGQSVPPMNYQAAIKFLTNKNFKNPEKTLNNIPVDGLQINSKLPVKLYRHINPTTNHIQYVLK